MKHFFIPFISHTVEVGNCQPVSLNFEITRTNKQQVCLNHSKLSATHSKLVFTSDT